MQELLQLVHAEDLMKGMDKQIDAVFQSTMQQVIKGETPTPEQQKALDTFEGKLKEILHRRMSWEEVRSHFMQIYGDTLSQNEVDGMIAFYKTPTGQAVIKKMPLIVQASMNMMQKRMPALMEEVQQAAKESFKDLKPSK